MMLGKNLTINNNIKYSIYKVSFHVHQLCRLSNYFVAISRSQLLYYYTIRIGNAPCTYLYYTHYNLQYKYNIYLLPTQQ